MQSCCLLSNTHRELNLGRSIQDKRILRPFLKIITSCVVANIVSAIEPACLVLGSKGANC